MVKIRPNPGSGHGFKSDTTKHTWGILVVTFKEKRTVTGVIVSELFGFFVESRMIKFVNINNIIYDHGDRGISEISTIASLINAFATLTVREISFHNHTSASAHTTFSKAPKRKRAEQPDPLTMATPATHIVYKDTIPKEKCAILA
jgi:hypothetical protein